MVDPRGKCIGMKLLIRTYRDKFRIPENLNHYSEEDYQAAEQKYVKLCLQIGASADRNEQSA
jgi:hypothetical protein